MKNSEFINKLLIAKENIGDILLLIDRMVYLEKIEQKYNKLQETNSKLQERNKKLEKQKPEEFSRILREFNDLKIKNENQYNRLKRLELTIKDIPGYKMEDKQNYLEFFVENIIPWLERSSEAKALKVIRKWFYNFENREKEGKERLGKYYVYTHRILGEEYPFYVGMSSNNDGKYRRSREYGECRNKWWTNYVESRGGDKNIVVEIVAEIDDERGAMELERYYIDYYAKMAKLVNIVGNKEDNVVSFLRVGIT